MLRQFGRKGLISLIGERTFISPGKVAKKKYERTDRMEKGNKRRERRPQPVNKRRKEENPQRKRGKGPAKNWLNGERSRGRVPSIEGGRLIWGIKATLKRWQKKNRVKNGGSPETREDND